ncbi:MAG TPA: biliverdin-producing heme oxygenase [Acidisarcina sp.]
MDIQLLREATAADHTSVEDSVPLMGADLTLDTYLSVMRRMYGIVVAWEEYAAARAPSWMQPMLAERSRRQLLEEDLRFFGVQPGRQLTGGVPAGPADVALPGLALPGLALAGFETESQLLGAMYVMEGSRLGGLHIARHVESVLGLTPGRGDSYFRGRAEGTGAMWKEFLDVLRTRVPEAQADQAIFAARAMFRAFGEWMRGTDPPLPAAAHPDLLAEVAV